MDGDRERWNAKWRERNADLDMESPLLSDNAHLFPRQGKALDLAGGAGRNAMWLLRRGMHVTLVDVSDVALDKAEARAKSAGLAGRLKAYHLDLEVPELPFAPPFDVVMMMNYLDRDRRDEFARLLQPDGLLVACHPTTGRYAVELKELELWVRQLGFELLASWTGEGEGHGEAGVIARRRAVKPPADHEPDEPSPSEGPYR